MSKDQYYKRLESLFSSDSVAPEPTNGKAAELNEVAALRAKVAELESALAENAEAAGFRSRVAELESQLDERKRSAATRIGELEAALIESKEQAEARLASLEATLAASREEAEAQRLELSAASVAASEANWLQKRVTELEAALAEAKQSASTTLARHEAATAEAAALQKHVAELESTLTATEQGAAANVASLEAALAEAKAIAQSRINELETAQAHTEQTASNRIAYLETILLETKESAESRIAELEAAQLLSKESYSTRLSELETTLAAKDAEACQRIEQLEAALAQSREAVQAAPSAPVVEAAPHVDEAASEQLHQQAEAIHSLEAVIEHLPFMIYMKDAKDLSFTRFNRAAEQLLGHSRTDLLGKTDSSFFPEEAMAFTQKDREVLNGGTIVDIPEELALTVNKGPRLLHTRKVPIYGLDGKPKYLLGVSEDITERKQAEQRLRLQALALETTANAVMITDSEGVIEWVNPAFTRFTGYTAQEAIGQHTRLLKSQHHDQAFYKNLWETVLAGNTWRGEIINRRKDGSLYPEEQTITPVKDEAGVITHFIAVKQEVIRPSSDNADDSSRDIAERKLADDALRASQAQLSEVLRISQLAYWEYDVASDLFTFNDSFYNLLHTTAEQEGGYAMPSARYAQRFVHPDDGPTVGIEIQKALETTDPNYTSQVDHRFFYADGGLGYVSVRIRVDKDAEGRTVRTHGTNQDITDRKLAEEALRANQAQLSEVLQLAQLASWEYDTAINKVTLNDAFYALVHTTAEEQGGYVMSSETYGDRFIPPADNPVLRAAIQKVLESGDLNYTGQLDHRFLYGDGSLGHMTVRIRTEASSDGRLFKAHGTCQDITERKRAEEAVRASQAQLSEALRVSQLAYWEYDIASDLFTFNDSFYALLHTTAEEQGGYTMPSMRYAQRFVHPEDGPIVGAETQRAIETTDPNYSRQVDHRFFYADGGMGYISVRIRVEKDADGRTIKTRGTNQDITERKAAEEALRVSEARLSEALQTAKLAYWDYDVPNDQFIFNDQFLSIFHATVEQVGGYRMSSAYYAQHFVHPDDLAVVGHEIGKALNSTDKYYRTQIDHRITYADGGVGYISVRINIDRDDEGHILRYYGANQDITERKLAEEALAKQATQLETVAQVSIDTATLLNPDELLQQVVDLTKSQFGLYHAHVYLVNEDTEELVLTAGAGEVGRTMSAAGRRIALSQEQSLVARAARTRLGVTVNDVTADPGFLPNPLLPDTRSELATPLIVGGQVLGVLDVQSETANRFTEDDIRIHTILASQIAVALQNARQYREAQDAMHELDSLTRRLTREGWESYTTHKDAPISYTYDLNELRPLVSGEAGSNGNGLIEHAIVVRGQAIGRLAVGEAAQVDEETADIIAAVADRLSTHVDNLRLLEETEGARQLLDRRALELEAIAKVSAAAATILNQDELLQSVVDLTKTNLDLYHAHIYLLNEDGSELILAAGSGEAGRKELDAHHSISVSRVHSLVARVARTRQGVLSNDVSQEPDFLPNPYLPNTRSEVAVPMMVGDTLLGVFDTQSDLLNRFTDEDVQLKTTLAHQVAVALQNARYFQEQSATVERLRELDQLKSSFLANMSHELRTPLNSILGFAQVMLEGIDGDITETMENDLVIIQKNGQHLLNLISDILDMAKIEAGKMTLNPEIFDLQEVFDEVTDLTGPLARAKSLDLIVDMGEAETLELYADRVRLRQVMINLVNNAIKFTDTGSVRVIARRDAAIMRIVIKDTGIGIPTTHLETIFQEFTQVDASTTRKTGGTGLGLPISRHLIEMHGGRLWAESTGVPGEGSSLILELPVETPYIQ